MCSSELVAHKEEVSKFLLSLDFTMSQTGDSAHFKLIISFQTLNSICMSLQGPGFDSRPICVTFIVKVTLGQFPARVAQFSPFHIIPPRLRTDILLLPLMLYNVGS